MDKKRLDSTLLFFQTIQPLATSTPYEIHQNNSSRINLSKQKKRSSLGEPFLTSPIYSSTPKPIRHSKRNNKFPIVISQRRLQFTNNETKRMTLKNIKIWLL